MNDNVKNTLIAVVWALVCIPFALACAGAFYMFWDAARLVYDGAKTLWPMCIMWAIWGVSSGLVAAKCMSTSIHYCFKE